MPAEFDRQDTAWCPGCGNFGILDTLKRSLVEAGIRPHELVIVSGIGQAAKLPHYIPCNAFNGLHGRALPVATGIVLGNHSMRVIVTTGDGDCYGEGGNHLLHAVRRNVNVKVFVHNNQIYGLTKGQASPTSEEGMVTKVQPQGVISDRENPLALAIALDCSFVARGFVGDPEHLRRLMVAALNHKGFALLDILQPCVSFNRLNTYAWYKARVYPLEEQYDPRDRVAAFERSLEWGDKIPTGIFYVHDRPLFEERLAVLKEGPLVRQQTDMSNAGGEIQAFF